MLDIDNAEFIPLPKGPIAPTTRAGETGFGRFDPDMARNPGAM